MKIKIVSTGTLPPPIGGVTIFLKYFSEALIEKKNVDHEFFNLVKIFTYRTSYLHINASNSIKRFIYVLIGKVFFKKVFIVKHGEKFNLKNPLVKLSILLADGVFCLNDDVKSQLEKLNKRNLKHSTIFIENISDIKISKNKIKSLNNRPRLLFYANNSSMKDGKSVYGIDFLISCLNDLTNKYDLTIIDLSMKFKKKFEHSHVKYIDTPVNFTELMDNHDIYIRPTRSDGMSVALLEAGLKGLKCLASDAAERPSFVHTYRLDDKKDFLDSIDSLVRDNEHNGQVKLTSIDELVKFMTE